MSEDTGTSITSPSGQDPVYTTSVTATIGRPPRQLYFLIQVMALVVTIGVCWVSRNFHAKFEEMEIKDLSSVTTLAVAIGKLLTTPVGLAVAIFIVVGLGLLAVRGALDGFLKFLIWLNVLWLIGFLVLSTMGIWMPILKAKQALGH
jgi:hypothetical protein